MTLRWRGSVAARSCETGNGTGPKPADGHRGQRSGGGREQLTVTATARSTPTGRLVETPVPQKAPWSQKAWMARFDRTVATQVGRGPVLGRRDAGGDRADNGPGEPSTKRARDRLHGELGEPGAEPKVLRTGRELLLGSSFSFGGGGKDGAPSWGAWGRFATGGFETAPTARVKGDVGLLGADAPPGSGVAVSLSRGEGPFRLTRR